MKTDLKELSEEELSFFIKSLGQKPYRARQIINWIYKKHALSFDEMTNLPKGLREELKSSAFISVLTLIHRESSKDGTEKFLFELADGERVESVLIPESDRLTLCISSQAGCAMGCRFCRTGKFGLKRSLKAHEIVDQVTGVMRILAEKKTNKNITNIVMMGMGEPLDNLDEVISALWRFTGLMNFSRRKITLSTAGIVPKLTELAKKGPPVNLAISLNATTDAVRSRIMPVNRRYPLSELINACRNFPLPPRRRITFEYVLLEGINDTDEDAFRLVRLLKGIRAKVNLIPYNAVDNKNAVNRTQFGKPADDSILRFQSILLKEGLTAIIRKSKGKDIGAACGQLMAEHHAGC
jgi:23S rRNA (adenine2503-C2)-methyltransferase